ncbi:Class II abasic (AP) endonuclease [Entomortierella beljakovae]|nr:Class II abasic (AP) endonuclease [Entomortierella beljakovae]
MKFMTWNVNGIRALTQYHPYCDDLHKNYREILDYLDADVICFQETKITRSKLESDLALVPGYDSYWSFHKTKSGYSGVVTYVKDHIKLLAAEEGISGVLSGNLALPPELQPTTKSAIGALSQTNSPINDLSKKKIGGYPALEGDIASVFARYKDLDAEGRGVVLDFGFFVLFNLYCPNETDETRLPFKMDYYHLLEERVQQLIKEGKEVIVMGDMNVIPTELDHCDPRKWKRDCGESDFTNTLPRRWFNSFLAPNGPLTDLFRFYHKDEPGAFTCWNTLINARPSNYGTRLDFILVTAGLLPWFKSCDRKPHIVGSDHCPVIAEMFSELTLGEPTEEKDQDSKETRKLQDILDSFGGSNNHPLAAKFFDEFSGKQQKLSSFFKKPSQSTPTPTSTAVDSSTINPPATTISGDIKRPLPHDNVDDSPRKKAFFSKEKSSEDLRPFSQPSSQSSSQSATQATSSTSKSKSAATQPTSKLNTKSPSKPTTNKPGVDRSGSKKSNGTNPSGQQSVLSFFSSPLKKTTSDSSASKPADEEISEQATPSNSQQISESDALNGSQFSDISSSLSQPFDDSTPSSENSTLLPTETPSASQSKFSPTDFADWIPDAGNVMPFTTNAESTTSKWQSMFQPKAIPKCRFHGAPCTEYTVNKKGVNKGRKFFLCSLPVGPEGDSVGQKPEYRCNYFEWLNPEKKKQQPFK